MNDQEFHERLWAHPEDDAPEFLDAARSSQERESVWHDARRFNRRVQEIARRVQAPEELRDTLLRIPDQAANDDSFIRRILPVAAVLLLAISIGLYYKPEVNAALANDIFSHIYMEEPFYGDGSMLALADVNARMGTVLDGMRIEPGSAGGNFEVTFAKPCYIAKQVAMHLVINGKTGPVNLVMIPSQVVDKEMRIADQNYVGTITPTSGGTLVVIGSRQEPIAEYKDAMASTLNWEY